MPYERHGDITDPEDENAYIWRFIDLPKFLDMLTTRSLYFTRGDKFDDPYECMPPDEYMEVVRRGNSNLGGVNRQTRLFHYYRADYYINCWHMSPHESAGMWKLYAGVDAGIAIKSTYSRLKCAFCNSPERFFVGVTSYDHNTVFGSTNPFKFVMCKRPTFEHEREIRAFVWRDKESGPFPPELASEGPVTWPLPSRPGSAGIHLPVDLHQLIICIVLSPSSPPWMTGVLQNVLEKYGYGMDVVQSTLNRLAYVR
jgi:hypothetical protein